MVGRARGVRRASLDPRRGWLDGVMISCIASTTTSASARRDLDDRPRSTKVLALRAGVCQDFAHLTIAALRASASRPATSAGYLADAAAARPAAARRRRRVARLAVGVRAGDRVGRPRSHQRRVADRALHHHGLGRDYADVMPLRGVIVGGRGQKMSVGVSVVPEAERR